MRKERKEALLHSFPAVPASLMEQMKGRGAKNYVILLTNGNELFARCFHRYSGGLLVERQRYVFAGKEGFCRYRFDDHKGWLICKDFREPVFCSAYYGYNFDNSYSVLGWDAYHKSCMRYSLADKFEGYALMEYLKLYCKHPNMEYPLKAGYDILVEMQGGYWGGKISLDVIAGLDWKSNNLLKMLHLNRTEFKLLRGHEGEYQKYIYWRELYPKMPPAELLELAKAIGYDKYRFDAQCKRVGKTAGRLAKYLASQEGIRLTSYADYLDQCEHLHYDLHDTAICFPHDFIAMHARLSAVIKYEHDQKALAEFAKRKSERIFLEWQSGDYLIRQPDSMDEIVAEGRALCHCVAGYADRHAKGALHILFIRDVSKPDKPLATLELSADGKLRQVHGYGNDVKKPLPQEVKDFVNEWLNYIRPYFEKKERKSA